MSFFLGLLNLGYAEDVKSEYSEDVKSYFDFSVVFPKDDVVYLDGNPPLALIWNDDNNNDKEKDFDSKADFVAGTVYEVLIWGNNSSEEPICRIWLPYTKMLVVNTSIANEIGLESGKFYFWQVRRFSQSEGRMISTDMGSFSVAQGSYHANSMNFSGHLCGHVSTGHDFVEVKRDGGHTEELDVYEGGWYVGVFSTGSYSVCAGDQCHESVEIKALDITVQNF